MPLPAEEKVALWRNAGLGALSFAGLVLLTDGQSLVATADPSWLYFATSVPGWDSFGPFFASLLLLAILCLSVWAVWPARFKAEGEAVLLYILLILSAMLAQGFFHPKYVFWVWYRGLAAAAVVLVYLLRRRWLSKLCNDILIVCLCILVANIGFKAKQIHDLSVASRTAPSTMQAPRPGSAPSGLGRTVLVIFDEFDYRLAFESRPAGFSLPEFDGLRGESLFMTDARPAGVETMGAIPSYLTGKPFRSVQPDGPGRLILSPIPTGEPREFEPRTSLFGRLGDMGARSALIGFYHDYCHLLGGIAVDCRRFAAPDASAAILSQSIYERYGFARGFVSQLLLHPAWTSGLPYSVGTALTRSAAATHIRLVTEKQAEDAAQAMSGALDAASDPTYDFVYIHLAVPHPPGLASQLAKWVKRPLTGIPYFDNLLIADGFAAALRQRLEAAGIWDRTNVVLTSDHPLRRSIWQTRTEWTGVTSWFGESDRGRIPFYLKPSGGGMGAVIDTPVPLLCMHDLLLALIRREVNGMSEAKDWISKNAGHYPLRWPIKTISGRQVN